MAQRMDPSPPGGVMVSESTGRLVADAMELGESRLVHIKGSDVAVTAQHLLGIGSQIGRRSLSRLVGRRWEIAAIEAILDRSIEGHGSVISVVGPAGIGKSRIVAEATALAAGRGVPVVSTYCESHASDVPFRAVSRLLRGAFGVDGHADDQTARAHLRSRIAGAQPDDHSCWRICSAFATQPCRRRSSIQTPAVAGSPPWLTASRWPVRARPSTSSRTRIGSTR